MLRDISYKRIRKVEVYFMISCNSDTGETGKRGISFEKYTGHNRKNI